MVPHGHGTRPWVQYLLRRNTARQWFARSSRRMALIGDTYGFVMIGLGASLALTGRND